MVVPGIVLFLTGIAYYFFTQDAPDGNFKDLRARGEMPAAEDKEHGSFLLAAKDPRVWALFVVYAACFGVEITIDNIAALYFFDRFELSLESAGIIAGLFGLMNIFARALGGIFSDKFAKSHGLTGRVRFLFAVLFLEGVALVVFSQMSALIIAVISMVIFGLFVKMSNGATYGVVPFVNKKALGSVAGIVGAGGNAGAVAAGFLFRSESLTMQGGLFYLGLCVVIASLFVFFIRFSSETIEQEKRAFQEAQAQKTAAVGS
jgi:NNP family nitrate/nitrite transporter-like MFS transporter